MNENTQPVENTPNEIKLPTNVGKVVTLNIDDIKKNTVLIINVDIKTPAQKMEIAPVFSKLLAPYIQTLREKRVTVMLMSLTESITLLNEEEMNHAGWFKKDEKPLIINPFDKSSKIA